MEHSLLSVLAEKEPSLSVDIRDRIILFHEIIKKENEVQNLTRLSSPLDFYYGHFLDVWELLKTRWMVYPALDIGSGAGVPGLLASLMEKGTWILSESEKRKAEYLQRTVMELGLQDSVQVTSLRAETYLKQNQVSTLIARAVGPVDRIYPWFKEIQHCSTWNNLILFKGPRWEEEWKRFKDSPFKDELVIHKVHEYFVGPENKRRILVWLTRA